MQQTAISGPALILGVAFSRALLSIFACHTTTLIIIELKLPYLSYISSRITIMIAIMTTVSRTKWNIG